MDGLILRVRSRLFVERGFGCGRGLGSRDSVCSGAWRVSFECVENPDEVWLGETE